MHSVFETDPATPAIPITFVTKTTWTNVLAALPPLARSFAQASGFVARPGQWLALPSEDGAIAQVLFGLEDEPSKSDPFRPGALPGLLPPGTYRFANAPHENDIATINGIMHDSAV